MPNFKEENKLFMNKKRNSFLEFWYSHTRLATAMVLLVLNLVITFLFATIFALITKLNFFSALEYCTILALSSDGIWTIKELYSGIANYNILLIFHIIIIIIQTICYSGALIGFITTILSNIFENVEGSKRKLHLNNHYILLNWSSLGSNIIYDLSYLEGHKTVVILAEHNREKILNDIYDLFTVNNKKIKNIRFFVKEGSPFSSKNLKDISIEKAQSIGILLDESWTNDIHNDDMISYKDLSSFRLLMSLIHLVDNKNIVIEVEKTQISEKIQKLFAKNINSKNKISVFSHHEIIGHILGKAIIKKEYVDFYNEVLSYDGVEFYGISPIDITQALMEYNDFVPIVLYDDDDELDYEGKKNPDHLYILDEDGYLTKRKTPLKHERIIKTRYLSHDCDCSFYIVGDSNSLEYIIKELQEYKCYNAANLEYEVFSYKQLSQMVEAINKKKNCRKVLLLSQTNQDEIDQDANIFVNLLSLRVDYNLDKDVEVYAEITNPSNYSAVKNMGVAKTIVSNKLISLYMVQLLTHPNSGKFYRDILIPNSLEEDAGIDFEIVDAYQYLDIDEELTFSSKAELVQSFYFSTNKKNMIIAYKNKTDEKMIYLCSNMDKQETITIKKDTIIIVVRYN